MQNNFRFCHYRLPLITIIISCNLYNNKNNNLVIGPGRLYISVGKTHWEGDISELNGMCVHTSTYLKLKHVNHLHNN